MKRILILMALLPFFASAQIITTVAGSGTPGFSGDGGQATNAKMWGPAGTMVDTAGNIYIADYANARIRKVSQATGVITTIAGTGDTLFAGDGGAATDASLYDPTALALDASGNLYIADQSHHRIRMINITTGIITTIAGNGIGGYSADSVAATASSLYYPSGLAFDTTGNLIIADWQNHRIRKVDMATGIITTIAGTGTSGYTGNGGAATAARLYRPSGVAFDRSGNLFISEYGNSTVRKIAAATGIITTIAGTSGIGYAGDGGPGTAAMLSQPLSVATDTSGNVYIADWRNNCIRLVAATTGIITTIAGNGTTGYSGDGGPATAAQINFTDGVAIDKSGDMYIADEFNAVIRKVTCPLCAPASVGETSNNAMVSVYPNPAQNSLTIAATKAIATLSITNLIGQVVQTQFCNTNKAMVDISTLPKGISFVKINNTEVRKFLKE